MKKMMIVFMGLILCASTGFAFEKRYEMKSGIVEYQMTGQNSGTETLYFDDYGKKEARYRKQEMNIMGFTQRHETIDIIDYPWMYSYDAKSNQASKVNYEEQMKMFLGENQSQQQMKDFSESMVKAMGGVKIGTENILGKKADLYEMKNFGYKVAVWKGLPLKVDVNMMGFSFQMIAKDIKTNTSIDAAKFRLPATARIVEEQPVNQQVSSEDMQKAQEAMGQFQQMMGDLQNSPEYQQMIQKQQEFQNSAEYQQMIQQQQEVMRQYQQQYNASSKAAAVPNEKSFVEETVEELESETKNTVKDSLKDTTKEAIGGMFKSIFK
ncbi:MAG: hypothetical protein KC713_04495 [Candidatus Omnitrophica bacterium]|nr:hypothetical protein [Candidatus Omnitrophota bacterium]